MEGIEGRVGATAVAVWRVGKERGFEAVVDNVLRDDLARQEMPSDRNWTNIDINQATTFLVSVAASNTSGEGD